MRSNAVFAHRLASLSLGVALLCACSISAHSPDAPAEKDDPVVFRYKLKPYTVHDLTLQSYAHVQDVLDSQARSFSLADNPPLTTGFLSPATSEWSPGKKAGLESFYEHQLSGAVNDFVAARAFELLQQRHKIDASPYYHADKLADYTAKTAWLEDKYVSLLIASLGGSPADMYKNAVESFPRQPWSPKDWDADWNDLRKHRPYYVVNQNCLPRQVEAMVVPWYRDQVSAALLPFYVTGIIDNSREEYIKLLEGQFGSFKYFVIRSVHAADLQAMAGMIDLMASKEGDVDPVGYDRANATLAAQRAAAHIDLMFGTMPIIQATFKIAPGKLQTRKFIQIDSEKGDLHSYIFIFQEKPTPRFDDKTISSGPGNFLYDVGVEAVFTPIVEEVLRDLKIDPRFSDITLRPAKEIVRDPVFATITATSYGEELPALIVHK